MEVNGDVKTTMLLCDFAQEINGKLYIVGGGWNICSPFIPTLALAIIISVPWDETNKKHHFSILLHDENGKPIKLGDPPEEVRRDGDFEMGRPPGALRGSDQEMVMAVGFIGLPLEPSKGYRWQLEINGEPADYVSFRTGPPPQEQ